MSQTPRHQLTVWKNDDLNRLAARLGAEQHPFHPGGFSRLPSVLAVFGLRKSAWYAGIRDGRFPPPIKPLAEVER